MSKDFKIEPDGTVHATALPTEDFERYVQEHHINTDDQTRIVGWEIEGIAGICIGDALYMAFLIGVHFPTCPTTSPNPTERAGLMVNPSLRS